MKERAFPIAGGLMPALGAHLIWGSMPLYLISVKTVPVLEFVAWRTLFTLPVCALILALTGGFAALRQILTDGPTMLRLLGSATLIGGNWFIYVWAIQSGHVYAASLGYYILPLVMMLIGLVVLDEKLSRLQWWAVALAGAGVAALAAGALTTLWLSLALALSFGLYGLVRKTVKAGPLAGLAVESLLLAPVAVAMVAWFWRSPEGTAMGRDTVETVAVMMGAPLTAIPLMLFAKAARAMPYTVMGFLQFAAPTIVFLLGLLVFGEELHPAQLACFVAIWAAAAVFTWSLFRGSRPAEGGENASRGAAV